MLPYRNTVGEKVRCGLPAERVSRDGSWMAVLPILSLIICIAEVRVKWLMKRGGARAIQRNPRAWSAGWLAVY